MKPYSMMTEAELQVAVADYLRLQYQDVMFHSDFGSGVKLSVQQARRQKRQNGGRRAWPDLEIAQPRRWHRTRDLPPFVKDAYEAYDALYLRRSDTGLVHQAHGLYLELKKEGTRLKKKRKIPKEGVMDCGSIEEWATPHIAEQAKVLEDLRSRGYCAEFAVGFEEAKRIIDEYLGARNESSADA